ncbi:MULTISPECIES: hypothetical protein [Virgibacillus]|uniref:Uncharacterized protein n=1 Tax=Virgibacillus chiguensis TaxID=411959 RepID=A0A1M5VH66_9BACI|nr:MULTISPECIES: hypothetical protein [Virgibacillus]NWO14768.1 hypothetical protein [Virgibacillus sp.]SHH74566.1 hypothetical protein SAMN05421807_112118 [Virgibacillus chiguensis]
MDISIELERIIAIYFNGHNYIVDGVELSREESRLIAYSLIHTLQLMEMIVKGK